MSTAVLAVLIGVGAAVAAVAVYALLLSIPLIGYRLQRRREGGEQ